MIGELSRQEIDEVLSNGYIGRIGCRDGDKIYIVPVNYLYESGFVLCRSYEGQKVQLMRRTPQVCFEVEEMQSFSQWKTAIGWGVFEELDSPEEIRHVQERLSEITLAQKAIINQPPPAESAEIYRGTPTTIVYYRIRLEELSGRFERLA